MKWIFIFLGSVFIPFVEARESSLESWIQIEKQVSIERMFLNISPPDAMKGVVIASPSRYSPDYRYHWTRDASLVMDQVVWLYQKSSVDSEKYLSALKNFISLSLYQQQTPSAEGLGEPRYLINGIADTTPWARPQYDGPALRIQTLIHFLKQLKNENFGIQSEAQKVIKADLEFVIMNWRKPCFDLWEELKGLHFYTQAVQYAALISAAEYFKEFGDLDFSIKLTKESIEVKNELDKYWDEFRGYIGASRDLEIRDSNPRYKESNLDVSVILGLLHGQNHSYLSFLDDRLMATAHAIEIAFAREYRINQQVTTVAIGRFTDDVYYGGNPWYITTAAFAELYYRIGNAYKNEGALVVTKNNIAFLEAVLSNEKLSLGQKILSSTHLGLRILSGLHQKGDNFLLIVRKYVGSQGEMAEQFDRNAGVPVSAYDLTWSYASFLAAINFYN